MRLVDAPQHVPQELGSFLEEVQVVDGMVEVGGGRFQAVLHPYLIHCGEGFPDLLVFEGAADLGLAVGRLQRGD